MSMRERGNRGEMQAAAYLENKGYTILARNHCVRGGEVDIIAQDGNTTVFCEVKTRTQQAFGSGAEAVDIKKQRHICRAALDYAYKNSLMDNAMRFDVIEIQYRRISHITNAFDFIEPV